MKQPQFTEPFDIGFAAGRLENASYRRGCGDDRLLKTDDGRTFFLADGATGAGYGGIAAEAACRSVSRLLDGSDKANAKCDAILAIADSDVTEACRDCMGADTTGILVSHYDGHIDGASAGDSKAMLICPDKAIELTSRQFRKPRMGSGARPVPFSYDLTGPATLVMASDGLWDFCLYADILKIARSPMSAGQKVENLISLVATDTGEYPDDISVIVAHL